MPALHAKLSASGSGQWMNCPGSIRMSRGYPDFSSPAAAEGTAAHALAEHCLKHDITDVHTLLGDIFEGHTVDLEMADAIQEYVDIVRSYPGLLMVERRVDFSEWVPDGFGTADAIIIQPDGTCVVIDLKYGKGVRVDAWENTQAMLYMLGTYAEYGLLHEISKFKAVIVQPRLDHVSEYEIAREDLIEWAEKQVRPKALLALTEDAPLVPGEKQCRWCKAVGDCVALAEWSLNNLMVELADIESEDIAPTPPDKLTPQQKAAVIVNKKAILHWLTKVEEIAQSNLEDGELIPGFKLVESVTNRCWADEDEAEKVLAKKLKKSERTTTKLISPSQAEKLLGKGNEILQGLIVKPQGKPTIAPEYDKRPAIVSLDTELAGIESED